MQWYAFDPYVCCLTLPQKSVKVLMDYYFEKDPQHMCHVFEKWNYGEFNDDVSGVLVDFQPKQTTEKPKA